MGIVFQDPTIGKDAEKLAAKHGISIEKAVGLAVREKLEREEQESARPKATYEELRAIAEHCAALPVFDNRAPDEILGYTNWVTTLPPRI